MAEIALNTAAKIEVEMKRVLCICSPELAAKPDVTASAFRVPRIRGGLCWAQSGGGERQPQAKEFTGTDRHCRAEVGMQRTSELYLRSNHWGRRKPAGHIQPLQLLLTLLVIDG